MRRSPRSRPASAASGSAALDLAYVAAGRYGGFWEIGLKSWDTAAGIVMVREAGSQVSDMAGGGDVLGNARIVAGNQIHPQLLRALKAVKSVMAVAETDRWNSATLAAATFTPKDRATKSAHSCPSAPSTIEERPAWPV